MNINDGWGFEDDDNANSLQESNSNFIDESWSDFSEGNSTEWQEQQCHQDNQSSNRNQQGYPNQSFQDNNWSQQGISQQQSQQQPAQTADDYWQQENLKNQAQQGNSKKEFKPLSTAGVAVLAFVVLFVVLLLLIGISKIRITKQSRPQASTQQVSVVQQQAQQAGVDILSLKSVPESTVIDYSGEIMSTTGIVVAKSKYLQGSQMVYAVIINAEILGNKQEFYYYCGFDVYSGVQVSDLVQVNYQKVSKKCFSVNSVMK